jgi:hypothetical protein
MHVSFFSNDMRSAAHTSKCSPLHRCSPARHAAHSCPGPSAQCWGLAHTATIAASTRSGPHCCLTAPSQNTAPGCWPAHEGTTGRQVPRDGPIAVSQADPGPQDGASFQTICTASHWSTPCCACPAQATAPTGQQGSPGEAIPTTPASQFAASDPSPEASPEEPADAAALESDVSSAASAIPPVPEPPSSPKLPASPPNPDCPAVPPPLPACPAFASDEVSVPLSPMGCCTTLPSTFPAQLAVSASKATSHFTAGDQCIDKIVAGIAGHVNPGAKLRPLSYRCVR